MPRKPRSQSGSGVHHTYIRGVNRQCIFDADEDFDRFLRHARNAAQHSRVTILAYCLMSNHAHMIVEQGHEPLGIFFQRLGATYANWFNRKYDRVGHLWQDRFGSRPVEDSNDLINVIRYVHANPVAEGLCTSSAQYPWSSARGDSQVAHTPRTMELTGVAEWSELATAPILAPPLPGESPRRTLSDQSVRDLITAITGTANMSAFQRLDQSTQNTAITRARAAGASTRQLARITGLTRGRFI